MNDMFYGPKECFGIHWLTTPRQDELKEIYLHLKPSWRLLIPQDLLCYYFWPIHHVWFSREMPTFTCTFDLTRHCQKRTFQNLKCGLTYFQKMKVKTSVVFLHQALQSGTLQTFVRLVWRRSTDLTTKTKKKTCVRECQQYTRMGRYVGYRLTEALHWLEGAGLAFLVWAFS